MELKSAIEKAQRDWLRKPQGWKVGIGLAESNILSKRGIFKMLVDEADVPIVSKYRWYWKDGYAITSIAGKRIKMHHLLIGKPGKGCETDHFNRNRMDNRRSNLSFVLAAINKSNIGGKGCRKRGKTWEANVCVGYRKMFLNGFKTKYDALVWRRGIKMGYINHLAEGKDINSFFETL